MAESTATTTEKGRRSNGADMVNFSSFVVWTDTGKAQKLKIEN